VQTHFPVGTQSFCKAHRLEPDCELPVVVKATAVLSIHMQCVAAKAVQDASVADAQLNSVDAIAFNVISAALRHFFSLYVIAKHSESSVPAPAFLYT